MNDSITCPKKGFSAVLDSSQCVSLMHFEKQLVNNSSLSVHQACEVTQAAGIT